MSSCTIIADFEVCHNRVFICYLHWAVWQKDLQNVTQCSTDSFAIFNLDNVNFALFIYYTRLYTYHIHGKMFAYPKELNRTEFYKLYILKHLTYFRRNAMWNEKYNFKNKKAVTFISCKLFYWFYYTKTWFCTMNRTDE
jgi:hypothetical protein